MEIFDHKECGDTLLENRNSTGTGWGVVRLSRIKGNAICKVNKYNRPAEIQGLIVGQGGGHEGQGGFDLL